MRCAMAEVTEDGGPTWRLRVRGPKGCASELVLPEGERTTAGALQALAGKAVRVAAKRVIVKVGFPPRPVTFGTEGGTAGMTLAERRALKARTVGDLGLSDRQLIVIERKPSAEAEAAAEAAATAEAAAEAKGQRAQGSPGVPASPLASAAGRLAGGSPAKKARRVGPMPGVGRRVQDGEVGGETLGTEAVAGEGVSVAALALASRGGGGGGQSQAMRDLRAELRRARAQLEDERKGVERYAAAIAGRCEVKQLQDGRLAVQYGGSAAGSRRKANHELVGNVIPVLLRQVVLQVVHEVGDASASAEERKLARANLQPAALAAVSPRVFWSVVFHGKVGRHRDFVAAMQELVPGPDWRALMGSRERAPPVANSP